MFYLICRYEKVKLAVSENIIIAKLRLYDFMFDFYLKRDNHPKAMQWIGKRKRFNI